MFSNAAHLLHALRMEEDNQLVDEEHQRCGNAENSDCGAMHMPINSTWFGETASAQLWQCCSRFV